EVVRAGGDAGLAERRLERLAERARVDVDRPARVPRHDEAEAAEDVGAVRREALGERLDPRLHESADDRLAMRVAEPTLDRGAARDHERDRVAPGLDVLDVGVDPGLVGVVLVPGGGRRGVEPVGSARQAEDLEGAVGPRTRRDPAPGFLLLEEAQARALRAAGLAGGERVVARRDAAEPEAPVRVARGMA